MECPKHYPRDLSLQFAADPFDKRMRTPGPQGHLVHTPLGLLLEIHEWLRQNPKEIPPSFRPILKSVEQLLQQRVPAELQRLQKPPSESGMPSR
jgi:hypothetical protein